MSPKKSKVKFYKSDSWNEEYELRIPHYREIMEDKFKEIFNWDADGETLKKMIRCEMELIALDRAIVNEATKQNDGFLFVPKHLIDQRDRLRKADNSYHKTLMLDMEVRIRNKVSIIPKGTQKDRWEAALSKADEDYKL